MIAAKYESRCRSPIGRVIRRADNAAGSIPVDDRRLRNLLLSEERLGTRRGCAAIQRKLAIQAAFHR